MPTTTTTTATPSPSSPTAIPHEEEKKTASSTSSSSVTEADTETQTQTELAAAAATTDNATTSTTTLLPKVVECALPEAAAAAAATIDDTTTSTTATLLLPKVVECALPEGIAIRPNTYGLGLFATKNFKKGDVLYLTSCLYVPDVMGKLTLRITNTGEEYELDMEQHSVVEAGTNRRQLYTFDAYENHSCAPNTTSFVTSADATVLKYGMVATREIVEGAELTCDYCLFEFEAGSASIMNCQCGATECIKEIKGFRYLTFPQALARFASAEGYVIEAYLEEHPEIYFLDLRSPKSEKGKEEEEKEEEEEVGIDVLWVGKEKEGGQGQREGGKIMLPKVVATKSFAAGEVVLGGMEFNK